MGVLRGYRILEFSGIGPAPMCAMLLSDLGAEVIRLDNPAAEGGLPARFNFLRRGRRSVALDLKRPAARVVVMRLVEKADALVEGFRPGVMERLGLGPEECLARNPRLIYGRMTGWGQEGPLARAAGHDINYIALSGALHAIGRAGQPPVPPLNLVGDFGGGALFLALGIVAGLLEAHKSGKGQVIDAAVVDGAAYLMTAIYANYAAGAWSDEHGVNLIDSGAPFYDVYETRDGKYVSVGALEAKFYAQLCQLCGLNEEDRTAHDDRRRWPEMKRRLSALFASKTREEWCALLEGTDACFAPVLSMAEAPAHPHNRRRGTFVEFGGAVQPAPAPRFSRTPSAIQGPAVRPGEHTEQVLRDWGICEEEIREATRPD
ncbi:MAG TPA: CaiB/BaiF CoA-transferase family protein [Terriglobales bacterium]|nr:CaiB/BaiF CoA-transferase family protein [Terriglobales bacterium]